jgi:general secretion pathway protein D
MLILTDRASNMERILNIIRRIDRAGAEDVDFIRLEYASAGDVVQKLSALSQATQAAGNVAPIQAIADERTNSVLLSGPQTIRLRYRAYVMMLDTPTEGSGDTTVRYLNYADAEDLAGKLQSQFGGAVAAGEGGAAAAGGSGEVSIWFDQGTNALVMSAPTPILQRMHAIIDQIDIPRAQVLVEAIIVEVGEDKAAQLGATFLTDGSASGEAVGLTNFSGTTGGILSLAAIGAGGTPDPSAISDGITAAVGRIRDSGTSWAAVISALRGDATTNIISTPTILTLDNEEAEIRVGQEVPFLSGQFTNTGANQGSVNPFQTIQREEVGTSLKITPQINEGSGVKLTIEQETSSISAGAAGAVDLVTNKRTITTSVFVNDGDVLVLGGLIDDQLRQSEQRVPGLGRIPGLGWLFRARKTDRVKTNLMVFIRPTILRDSVDARFQTNAKYDYIRNLQRLEAETPVRLMREENRPELPELTGGSSSPSAAGATAADPD